MASAHPASVHRLPNTLEAAVMIRSGLGREVAITLLKSLWTFLSAGLDSSSFGERAKPRPWGWGWAGKKSTGWEVGKALLWRQIISTERKWTLKRGTGNLLRIIPVEGKCPAVSDSKVFTPSAPLAASPRGQTLTLALCREGGSKNFHCRIKDRSSQTRSNSGHYSSEIYENHK